MNSRDQIYREACNHYEKGELDKAVKLFSKALDCFIISWEDKKKIKAHYYRGCALYRLGIECERNQMFEKSKEKFQSALDDFDTVSDLILKINGVKGDEVNYYEGCSHYTLGILYKKKQEYKTSRKKFQNARDPLENASSCDPYKKKSKLWFYKGIAEYENKDYSKYSESLKKAATYGYYDIGILKKLLPEKPSPSIIEDGNDAKRERDKPINIVVKVVKDEQAIEISKQVIDESNNQEKNKEKDENLKNISILYYLKRYSDIISIYSNDHTYKNIENLIKYYSEEGTYYCALSHYEFKEFKMSLKILNVLIKSINDDNVKIYKSENQENKNKIEESPIFLVKLVLNSWYYKGIILHELRNNFNEQKLLEVIFDEYSTHDLNKEDEEYFKNLINKKDNIFLKEYRSWCKDCKALFVKYLSNIPKKSIEEKRIIQKVFDIESQTAFEKALEEYNKLIETFQAFELYYEKALVLDELKRYKEAIEALDEFLKIKPRDSKAWLKKGTILFKLAKNEGIKTVSSEPKTVNKKGENPCEKEITRIEAAKNSLEKAIGYFKILIDENPGNPDHWYNRGTAHSSLAEVLIKTRDYQGALKEYEEAAKAFDNATTLNPIFALAWNNKGNAYSKLKKYNKAIEAFEKAFEINPNYYLAWHNKGDALYSLGKYNEAIEIYEQVTRQGNEESINTVSYKSYNNKGLAYYRLAEYNKAMEAFDKAIEINPTFADALTNRGLVFYKLEMFSKAKKAFKNALELDPGNPRASNNLAVVLAREGELDQAKGILENILEENPDFVLGSANLAELYLNSGGIERASEKINSILKDDKNPDSSMGYVHFMDGRIKIEDIESREKKYSEAAKSFEKAASFNIEDPTSLLWLVYVKYLCQKFDVDRKIDSSEKQNSGKENVSPKTEDTCSNELTNSIVSDLGKVLNFCSTPAVKRSSLPRLLDQNRLWEIIVAILFLYGFLYFFEISKFNIQNIFNVQMPTYTPNYLDFIAIGLILLIILFNRKITWPIIVIVTLILLFGSYYLNYSILSFVLLISTVLIVSLKLLDLRLVKPTLSIILFTTLSIILFTILLIVIKIVDFSLLEFLFTFLFTFLFALLFMHLIPVILVIILIMSKLLRLIDKFVDSSKENTLELQIKAKQYLIKFNKYKEIKAYTLYLLGYFCYKLQDYTTSKEKLQECISLKPDDKTDKAARELLDNIWKHKIKPPFWTYWFNSPVNTWRRRAFGTFVILGILLILFVHVENPQPVAWNESTSNNIRNFFPGQINFYPYIISYPLANNTTSSYIPPDNNSTAWNILTPARVNIYPDIPDSYFDAFLLLILILALIYPSVRIAENVKLILKKGSDVSLDLGPIVAPPEFNFELSPSLMQDVIKRLDENL